MAKRSRSDYTFFFNRLLSFQMKIYTNWILAKVVWSKINFDQNSYKKFLKISGYEIRWLKGPGLIISTSFMTSTKLEVSPSKKHLKTVYQADPIESDIKVTVTVKTT